MPIPTKTLKPTTRTRPSKVSNLTKPWLKKRQQEHLQNMYDHCKWNGDNLDVFFKCQATPVPGQKQKWYTVTIRFLNAKKTLTNPRSRSDLLQKIKVMLQRNLIQVDSTDPSFYYQGTWESLSKRGLSIRPFTGPKGKGIWDARHNKPIRATKHIGDILTHPSDWADTLLRDLSS